MAKPSSRIVFVLAIMLVAISSLSAKGTSEVPVATQAVISYTDDTGNSIALSSVPTRIVSMGPNVTETLFALGSGDVVVGRTDYCDYPQAALSIESIGTLWQPSLEKIVSLEPDLIIASSLANAEVLQALRKTGIPMATINKQASIEGTFDMIEDIGTLSGREEQAQALVASMRQQIAHVQEAVASLDTPSVYYVLDFGSFDSTATGDTYINEMIGLAGGRNIATDASNWTYTKELLVQNDPDIIILSPRWGETYEQTLQAFASTSVYKDLRAVKEGQVYPIDNNAVDRQGPRTAYAVEQFAKILHPQAL